MSESTGSISRQKRFLGDPLSRLFKPSWFVKNMAASGRGLFFLYIYIENLKNLLVRNHWTDFINTWQKSFLVDPQQVQVIMIRQKTWPPGGGGGGGGGLFSLYICIEKFKNFLVRNQWTNFNITWQECCFGNPLPRLFKPSWFVRKHGR